MRPESRQHLSKRRKWDTAGILLDETAVAGPMDAEFFAHLFGNTHPVELEIGSGKGTFLLERGAGCSEHNLLGVEYARSYCEYAADRIRRARLGNVRVVAAEAGHLFRVALADASVWRVYIFFPDPWPKRRHRRRRLIQPPFVGDLTRVLRSGGVAMIVTDHLDYFQQIQAVLDGAKGLAKVPLLRFCDAAGELVGTNFERKYIAQGRSFYATARMKYV